MELSPSSEAASCAVHKYTKRKDKAIPETGREGP
jgi:hypothetical protein